MPLLSKYDTSCIVCNQAILKGAVIRPLESSSNKKWHINYSHTYCIPANDERVPICKHWSRYGKCMYMDICDFRHPENQSSPNNQDIRRGARKRRRIYNDGRAAALRRWLIRTFGESYLRSGSGVLDVAGGKGEFSFELLNLNHIPSTVIDPRPLELNRYIRRLRFGYYHRNGILGVFNTVPFGEPLRIPRHIRIMFELQHETKRETLSYIDHMYPVAISTAERFEKALSY
eukprot:gene2520-4899_t